MAPKKSALDMWAQAESYLPENLNEMAIETGAIRRPRRVSDATQLLRAFLIYANVGSLRTAAALAGAAGLLKITGEGLFYRLWHAEAFLEKVLAHLVGHGAGVPIGFKIRLVDATGVSGPGATGTDWRIHVGYDPCRGLPCSIKVGGAEIGEHLKLHDLQPGELVLADRGYGSASNVHEAIDAGADLLIRISKGQIRLYGESERVDWDAMDSAVPETGAVSFQCRMPVPPAEHKQPGKWKTEDAQCWHDVRIVAARNTRKEVVWLITNLDEQRLGDAKACEMYRVRWQVELYFKRLKSLGDLDVQRSRAGPTAKAGLLAKLILLVLTSLLRDGKQAFSPYGYPVRQARTELLERVRLHPEKTRGRAPSQKPPAQTAV
jgi:hypothetical protein